MAGFAATVAAGDVAGDVAGCEASFFGATAGGAGSGALTAGATTGDATGAALAAGAVGDAAAAVLTAGTAFGADVAVCADAALLAGAACTAGAGVAATTGAGGGAATWVRLATCGPTQMPLTRERPGGQGDDAFRRSARTSKTCDVDASAEESEPAAALKLTVFCLLAAKTKHAGSAPHAATFICVTATTADRLVARIRLNALPRRVGTSCQLGFEHIANMRCLVWSARPCSQVTWRPT